MPYEIDYLPVGEGEKSGDAICLRFGNIAGPRSEQTIMVIDGGDKTSGEALVAHIRQYYGIGNDGYNDVDYVISTHPDGDHASGLCTVLENLKVGTLLMHRPWDYAGDIKDAFSDGRWTVRGLGEKIEKSLKHANELEAIATRKGIKIIEPFQGIGTADGTIRFLGPSKEFYQQMVTAFRGVPAAKVETGLLSTIFRKAEEAIRLIEDRWDLDLLNDDDDTTSAENNTSTILLLTIGTRRILFTADAGKTALLNAIAYAESLNISLVGLELLQVPHHGSRRNLNSKILKKMNGQVAHISASGENKKHPSKRVTNALKKHGAQKITVNRKQSVLHHFQANHRGWTGIIPDEPFHDNVEE
ncbi:MBL fold metallo-hydrolase [Candidatus Gracilibacteria bacterium]|nr:MBL fold metallo-hydrolase [Candidatus Gracilibacteria bacterium]